MPSVQQQCNISIVLKNKMIAKLFYFSVQTNVININHKCTNLDYESEEIVEFCVL